MQMQTPMGGALVDRGQLSQAGAGSYREKVGVPERLEGVSLVQSVGWVCALGQAAP